MASSNRVFVSPGVYTSEKDLTFVAQSVGVTTLGLVGETLKGPAFEPILISNFDEFKTYFGPSSPIKDGQGNPKYELPYVAKSYLEESNQLFVTRVLGLTGYKPNKTFGIKTLGGVTVDLDTVSTSGVTMDPDTPNTSPIFGELSGKTAHNGSSITTYIQSNFSGYTNADNGKWFVLGQCDADDVAALTAGSEVISPLTGLDNETSNHEKEWYNTFFNSGATITNVYGYLFVYSGSSGVFNVTRYAYDAELNSDYHNVVVAALRPRGSYSGQTLLLEVTGSTVGISETTGFDLDSNPLGEFTLNVTGSTSGAKSFTCSLDTTSTKYITKVLGTDVFDKVKSEFPLYVHESYPNLLKTAFDKGLIRGLSTSVEVETDGNNFLGQWDTTISPMVVSEVRGGEVADLFEVITISDGESANFQVKITIQNIDLDTGDFDLDRKSVV